MATGLPYARPTDGNGAPFSGPYDPTTHQNVMPQAGPVQTDSNNNALYAPQYYAPIDGQKATYSAGILGLAVAASATDIFTIAGAAGVTVRVTRLRISGFKTTAGAAVDVQLIKRSSLDTAGTKTNPVATPYDSNSPAANAVIAAYTANPTLGTQVGTSAIIAVDSIFVPLATAGGSPLLHDFGNRPAQGIVLRKATEQLAVNLNGVTVGGGTFDIWVEWTEDTYS